MVPQATQDHAMQDSTPPGPTRHARAEPTTPQGGRAAPGVLQAVCWGHILFGAVLLMLPGVARAGFALLVWGVALLVALRAPGWRAQAGKLA
jgi:Flp pilus assembly protein TadB